MITKKNCENRAERLLLRKKTDANGIFAVKLHKKRYPFLDIFKFISRINSHRLPYLSALLFLCSRI